MMQHVTESGACRRQSLMALHEPSAVQADLVSIVPPSHSSSQESLFADMVNHAKAYECMKKWGAGALFGIGTCQISYTLHFWLFHPSSFQL